MAALKLLGIPASSFAGFVPKWVTKKEAEEIYPVDKLFTYSPVLVGVKDLPILSAKQLLDSILQNNNSCELWWRDEHKTIPIVKCKVKPGNMPLHGVSWIEYTPEN